MRRLRPIVSQSICDTKGRHSVQYLQTNILVLSSLRPGLLLQGNSREDMVPPVPVLARIHRVTVWQTAARCAEDFWTYFHSLVVHTSLCSYWPGGCNTVKRVKLPAGGS